MANNNLVYNAALAGALAAQVSERWITDATTGDYIGQRNAAIALAQAVDSAIPTANVTDANGRVIAAVVGAVLGKKAFEASGVTSAMVAAIVAMYNEVAPSLLEEDSGGTVEPIPGTYWVDPLTTAPVDEQTGAISAPFASVLQGFNALVAFAAARGSYTAGTLILCDGPYSEETFPTITWDISVTPFLRWINLIGFGNAYGTSAWVVTGDGDETVLNVVNLTNPFGAALTFNAISGFVRLRLRDSSVGIIEGQPIVTMIDSQGFDSISCIALTALNGDCSGVSVTATNAIESNNCQLGDIQTDDTVLLRNAVAGNITAGSNVTLESSELPNNGLTAGGNVIIRQSIVNGNISCPTGSLTIDSESYAYLSAAARTLDVASVVLEDPPQYVIGGLTVTVPTLASGEIGYANVSIAGTTFANVIVSGDPIIAYPVNDFAGGALLNARVVDATTARLCFIGPHPGGDESVNIARIR